MGRAALLLVLLALLSPDAARTQELPPSAEMNLDSLAKAFVLQGAGYSSPLLDRHRAFKREFFGDNYALVLKDVVQGDPVSAAIAYARVRLQGWLSLPHQLLLGVQEQPGLILRDPVGIALPGGIMIVLQTGRATIYAFETWDMPVDPWRRE